jgi:hypothetical protein
MRSHSHIGQVMPIIDAFMPMLLVVMKSVGYLDLVLNVERYRGRKIGIMP